MILGMSVYVAADLRSSVFFVCEPVLRQSVRNMFGLWLNEWELLDVNRFGMRSCEIGTIRCAGG